MTGGKRLIKHCITCRKDGHTYLECPEVNFFSVFCGAVGVEPIIGPSLKDTSEGIARINSKDFHND